MNYCPNCTCESCASRRVQRAEPRQTSKLIPIAKVQVEVPTWPYSPWSTGYLIREGRLRCVRVGRRMYVTPELLQEFIDRHVDEEHPA